MPRDRTGRCENPAPSHLPAGTVTFLFTDVERSTKLYTSSEQSATLGARGAPADRARGMVAEPDIVAPGDPQLHHNRNRLEQPSRATRSIRAGATYQITAAPSTRRAEVDRLAASVA